MKKPLSMRIRPKTFDEFVGHKDVLTRDFKEKIRSGNVFHLILWGPPGSGKTTLALLIEKESGLDLIRVSGAEVGIKDIRKIIEEAKKKREFFKKETILFIDEIHRLNRKEQDFLLSFVENRDIVLIGATTENPYFYIVPPLLSRCFLIELSPYSEEEMKSILEKGLKETGIELNGEAKDFIVELSRGDARFLLNILESLEGDIKKSFTKEEIQKFVLSKRIKFDKVEEHYNLISALIKSIRGSDPDASLYYLMRLIEGGEDLNFITRRLIILSSEDIGLSDPFSLVLATSGAEAVERVGLPEAKLILSELVLYLSKAPKSNKVLTAMKLALEDVKKYGNIPVPLHLRNPSVKGLKEIGWGKGYIYPHDHPEKKIEYLPKELKGRKYLK
ncbi:MAG: replication-associated recombination protein A [Caldiserica bacterium]|nr:MAG: replication-associated recombination protein A [Caldisericota bacterium]